MIEYVIIGILCFIAGLLVGMSDIVTQLRLFFAWTRN